MDIQTFDTPREKIAAYLAERGVEVFPHEQTVVTHPPSRNNHAWCLQAARLWPECLVWQCPFDLKLSRNLGFYVPEILLVNRDGTVKAVYHIHGRGWEHDVRYAAYQRARGLLSEWDFQYVRRTRSGWVLSDDAEDTYSQADQGGEG